MRFSIIIVCYNTLALIKKCVETAIETTDADTEIILVNNHPPYEDAMDYLSHVRHPRLLVHDPGNNIGNMPGFRYGAKRARGQYIVWLNDDFIVPKIDWLQVMYKALLDFPDLAYVSLTPPGIQVGRGVQAVKKEYTIEFHDDFVYIMCVMIKKDLYLNHFSSFVPVLYGGSDGHFKRMARQLGLRKGYLISHVGTHLGRTDISDPLYGVWKVLYAKKHTQSDYMEWKKSFSMTDQERNILEKFGYPDDQLKEIQALINQKPNRKK